jgi:hypothetical protein
MYIYIYFWEGLAGVCSFCPRSVASVADVFSGFRPLAMLQAKEVLNIRDCPQQEECDVMKSQ